MYSLRKKRHKLKSKYFKIHELVPKKMYIRYGEDAWRYVDRELIADLDRLKEVFSKGKMTINNYHWDGDRQWSGIRTPESKYYNYGSQHSYGRAFDIVFSEYTAKEVRRYILDHQDEFIGITRMEDGVSWLHMDKANTSSDSVELFTV